MILVLKVGGNTMNRKLIVITLMLLTVFFFVSCNEKDKNTIEVVTDLPVQNVVVISSEPVKEEKHEKEMPNVVGMLQSDAKKALGEFSNTKNIYVNYDKRYHSEEVISQSVDAKTLIALEQEIIITINSPRNEYYMEDLVGQNTRCEIVTKLNDFFDVVIQKVQYDNNLGEGYIFEQNIKQNTLLKDNEVIILKANTIKIEPTSTPTPVVTITPILPTVEIGKLGLGRYKVAEKDLIIESERFIINIGVGVVYPIEFEAFMNEVFDVMEEETGLSFFPVGYEKEKVSITVSLDSNLAYGGISSIHVAQMDMFIYSNQSAWVYLHELHHVLQMRHCSVSSQIFMEGYATYGTYDLEYKLSIISTFDTLGNYYKFDNELKMIENAEKYYLNATGWDAYLYGFRMAYYLETIYGPDFHSKLILKLQNDYGKINISSEQLVKELKQMTSEQLFADFVTWYDSNKLIFNKDPGNEDLRKIDTYHLLPKLFINNNVYNAIGFIYDKEVIIDFKEGFGYLQQLGKTINGIYGYFYSDGMHTIEFYNNDDEILLTQSINKEKVTFQVPGAVKIKVTGDQSTINFVYYYSDMVY